MPAKGSAVPLLNCTCMNQSLVTYLHPQRTPCMKNQMKVDLVTPNGKQSFSCACTHTETIHVYTYYIICVLSGLITVCTFINKCHCGYCEKMPTTAECVCCSEIEQFQTRSSMDPLRMFSALPDMKVLLWFAEIYGFCKLLLVQTAVWHLRCTRLAFTWVSQWCNYIVQSIRIESYFLSQ